MKNYPRFTFSDFSSDSKETLLLDDSAEGVDIQELVEMTGADAVVRTITTHDLEIAAKDGYDEGYKKATEECKERIEQLQEQHNLHDQLHNLLLKLDVGNSQLQEKIGLVRDVVKVVVDSLVLSLPSDFQKILDQKIVPLLSNYLTEGKIVIKLHSSEYQECSKALDINSLPSHLQDRVEIVEDDKGTKGNYVVTYGETSFSYNRQELLKEITAITDKFITDSK